MPVTDCVPAATPLVEFLQAHRYPLNTRSNDGEGEDFLPSRVFQVYDCYFTNVLTQRSCFEVLLTADSQCFTRDDARTLVPTIPRRRRAFIVSLNIEVFIHSCEQCGHFFHQAPPSPVSSPSQSPPSFPSPSLSTRRNPHLFDRRRHESHQTISSYQLCRIWEHPQCCFPPFGQKPREA